MRAACAFALGTFVAAGGARTEHANALDQQVGVQLAARLQPDASPLVRHEILAGTYSVTRTARSWSVRYSVVLILHQSAIWADHNQHHPKKVKIV